MKTLNRSNRQKHYLAAFYKTNPENDKKHIAWLISELRYHVFVMRDKNGREIAIKGFTSLLNRSQRALSPANPSSFYEVIRKSSLAFLRA
jgi:hypothetical protein